MKLVSCICPSKRSIVDLQRTIDNFLAQTYPCKELIILRTEGGAFNGRAGYPNDLVGVHYRIVPPGLSIGELRNIACRIARGSVLAHFDDDDLSHPERLARSVAAIDAGASLVGSGRVIYERYVESREPGIFDGTVMSFSEPKHEGKYKLERWLFDGSALFPVYLIGGTMVYRRELWERRNFEDVQQGEDSKFQWRLRLDLGEGAVVDLADESLYTARISSDATSPKDTESPGWSRL